MDGGPSSGHDAPVQPADPDLRIEALTDETLPDACPELARLLIDCVTAGASLGFMAPLAMPEAVAYWRSLAAPIAADAVRLLAVRTAGDGALVGTGQLWFQQKPNGRHRAEVSKVMVAPAVRRSGIATRLMTAIEEAARDAGVTLLHLDTSEGSGGARGFYESLGWTYAGGIPGYALDPDGTPAANAIFFRRLG